MADNRVIVLDMDGTIANLYGVHGWLEDLRAFNPRPYAEAKIMYDMDELNEVLSALKEDGWSIVVTSWLSKVSNKDYDKKVRQAKREWIARHKIPVDEIHIVKYGTPKANCTRKLGGYQILIDDEEQNRKTWHLGSTIDAGNEDIIEQLVALLK